MHAEPLQHPDRPILHALGHLCSAARWRARRFDAVGNHHGPVAFECRLRHRYVGQMASRQSRRPAAERPRLRRVVWHPAYDGRGHVAILARLLARIVRIQKIMEGKRGEKSRAPKDYDLEQRRLLDEEVTKRSVAFIERQAKVGKPFFAYLALTQPHLPTLPNPAFAGKTGNGDWADTLSEIDYNVGQLLDAIDKVGIRDNTIVIFTSDNGAEFFKPWNGWAGPWRGTYVTALEGGLRVPFIVRWPGKIPAGRVSNEIVHGVDMFATLAKFTGAKVPTTGP